MCFSADASFTAAGLLALAGTVTVSRARELRQWPLAVMPFLFSVQQGIEGVLWRILPNAASADAFALAIAFVLLAEVIWPVLMPAAMLLIEPDRRRRALLIGPLLAGLMVGGASLIAVIEKPLGASIVGCSIRYGNDFPYFSWWPLLYWLSATAPLMSSHRPLQAFGALLLIGYAVSAYAYAQTLTSVWCFFAALASTVLLAQFIRGFAQVPARS